MATNASAAKITCSTVVLCIGFVMFSLHSGNERTYAAVAEKKTGRHPRALLVRITGYDAARSTVRFRYRGQRHRAELIPGVGEIGVYLNGSPASFTDLNPGQEAFVIYNPAEGISVLFKITDRISFAAYFARVTEKVKLLSLNRGGRTVETALVSGTAPGLKQEFKLANPLDVWINHRRHDNLQGMLGGEAVYVVIDRHYRVQAVFDQASWKDFARTQLPEVSKRFGGGRSQELL